MRTRTFAAAIAALLLSACSITIPIGEKPAVVRISKTEALFQAVNAVDFSTTINTARNRCYNEVGFPTRALIGRWPSERGVYTYWLAYSGVHLAVSNWLDRQVDSTDDSGWRAVRFIWTWGSILNSAHAVESNWRIGVRPFGGRGPQEYTLATCVPYFNR